MTSTATLKPHEMTIGVTGANGFIASEIIRQLLLRGYNVHGTVRDPNDTEKVGHLTSFVGSNNLRLFKAELTDPQSFEEALRDCQVWLQLWCFNQKVVLHTASPVSNPGDTSDPEKAFVTPALEGTTNVLDIISRAAPLVKTIVLTSSVSSISSNAGLLPETHVYSEEDWSPIDRLRELQRWYPLGKTLAEKAAWDHELIKSGKGLLLRAFSLIK